MDHFLQTFQVQLAKIRLRMNIVKNDLDTAVQNQEFVIAQEKKVEFETISEEEKVLLGEIEQATAVHLTPKVRIYFLSPIQNGLVDKHLSFFSNCIHYSG